MSKGVRAPPRAHRVVRQTAADWMNEARIVPTTRHHQCIAASMNSGHRRALRGVWCRQQESNLHLSLRRTLYYPLYDGDTRSGIIQASACHGQSGRWALPRQAARAFALQRWRASNTSNPVSRRPYVAGSGTALMANTWMAPKVTSLPCQMEPSSKLTPVDGCPR